MAKKNQKQYKLPILNHFGKSFVYKTELNEFDDQRKIKDLSNYTITTDKLRGYKNIRLFSFRREKKIDEDQIIFRIDECCDDKRLLFSRTGLYVGKLFFENGYTVDINTKYNDMFLKHMIAYVSNIYFDDTYFGKSNSIINDSDFNFFEYYFLLNFKKLLPKGLPILLIKKKECDVSLKGNIDLRRYISHDMLYNFKITYYKNDVVYDQNIIDVLYNALTTIPSNIKRQFDSSILKYEKSLKEMSSNSKNIARILERAKNSKALNNYQYKDYRDLIKFAEFIIKNKNLYDNNNERDKISGYLVDMSELWEIYLAKLLKNRLGEKYRIDSQENLQLYGNTFYKKNNYPDIVIRDSRNNTIAVIDAKFKTMNYQYDDVDRNDLFQINHYAFHYFLKEGYKLKFASLIYPSEIEDVNNDCINMYGLDDGNKSSFPKFKILTLKIPKEKKEFSDSMRANEDRFIAEVEECLNMNIE